MSDSAQVYMRLSWQRKDALILPAVEASLLKHLAGLWFCHAGPLFKANMDSTGEAGGWSDHLYLTMWKSLQPQPKEKIAKKKMATRSHTSKFIGHWRQLELSQNRELQKITVTTIMITQERKTETERAKETVILGFF